MSIKEIMSIKEGITRCTILALAICGLVAAMPMNASAQEAGCQASGSIPLFPNAGTTCGTALHVNDTKDILITVQNSSTTTPAPGTPVSAKLVGTITHIMACTSAACTTERPGTLEFVPVGANGCVSNALGVAGCAFDPSNSNHVLITMTADGVALQLTGLTSIATIRVRAVTPVTATSCGQFGEAAATADDGIVTTDATCAATAFGTAAGSTNEFFPPAPVVDITKSCVNPDQCTATDIPFTVRVTNAGPTTLSNCTVTDPDCTPAPPAITNLAPGLSVEYICSKPATSGGPAVDNSASVSCTDVNGQPAADSVTSNACTIPPTPTATITKTCANATDCDATGIAFTLTVTNGAVPITGGTITDPECCANGATCTFGPLAAGGTFQTTCTLPGSAGDTVTNPGQATVTVTSPGCQSAPSASADNVSCTIPPRPTATIAKTCVNATECTATGITFTMTVTNGPVAITGGIITDAECCAAGANCTVPALAPGATFETTCTLGNITPGAGGTVTNPGQPSVTVTANQCDSVPSSGQNNVACTIPACPCSVVITKAVAPDVDCNAVADSAFVENVTVDENVCVVYEICVTNTGQQVLNTNGVKVSDAHLDFADADFGTIGIGATVCKKVPSEIPAVQCPNGLCVCEDVSGTNTAVISSAICQATGVNACDQPGSDCSDTANVACLVPPVAGCRMTGGHVAMANVDSTFEDPTSGTHYSTGGQIGAPNEAGCRQFPQKGKCVAGVCTGGLNGGEACTTNADCPNDTGRGSTTGPWGDWEHNHHSGPDDSGSVTGGSFSFHSGTAASPDAAFIKSVICADTGWCVQARPAPNKQIFWEGTGVFHNIKGAGNQDIALPNFSACEVQPTPGSNKVDGTLHYYRAHVGDFGEPAGIRQKPADGCTTWFNECGTEPGGEVGIEACQLAEDAVCPLPATTNTEKSALHPLCLAQDCQECPDWYEIEIHCTADPASPVAYRVAHHITEGNFQLHPPVGSSCNPGACGDGTCDATEGEDCVSCPADCGSCP